MSDQPATPSREVMTVEEFDKYVALPENRDRLFEFIGGRIIDVSPSNMLSSHIATRIIFFLSHFIFTNNIEGYLTGADAGYMVSGERYIPDVAYISKSVCRNTDITKAIAHTHPIWPLRCYHPATRRLRCAASWLGISMPGR